MKSVFHKSIAILMAIVVLTATMSFKVDMHYCGNTMVDFAFFKDAKACKMESMPSELVNKNSNIAQNSCCSDKQLVVQGQDALNKTSSTFTIEQQLLFALFVDTYGTFFEDTSFDIVFFVDDDPPFFRKDLLLLYQTFLI